MGLVLGMSTFLTPDAGSAGSRAEFTSLAGWFARTGRDLPWRSPDVDAWAILVSEVMLQQTPVARVLPVWETWMRRWPSPAALAAEPAGEAVRAWGKLGYPRRALRLHECARVLRDAHGGVVPHDVESLLTLPGVGDYTARAVACFAYGRRAPVVDVNVRRVVARAIDGRGRPGSPYAPRDHAAVEALLPADAGEARVFSAALMELGALVCVARNPRCGECPLRDGCAWVAAGSPEPEGPPPRVQRFAGTDRQVRGRLMDVLRGTDGPVPRSELDVVWGDGAQRDRCLLSLLEDGLVELTGDGLFALAGEASVKRPS